MEFRIESHGGVYSPFSSLPQYSVLVPTRALLLRLRHSCVSLTSFAITILHVNFLGLHFAAARLNVNRAGN